MLYGVLYSNIFAAADTANQTVVFGLIIFIIRIISKSLYSCNMLIYLITYCLLFLNLGLDCLLLCFHYFQLLIIVLLSNWFLQAPFLNSCWKNQIKSGRC